MAFLDLEKA